MDLDSQLPGGAVCVEAECRRGESCPFCPLPANNRDSGES